MVEFRFGDDPEEISRARARGLRVMVTYTGNDPTIFRRIMQMEVEYLNLDYPFAYLTQLRAPYRSSILPPEREAIV